MHLLSRSMSLSFASLALGLGLPQQLGFAPGQQSGPHLGGDYQAPVIKVPVQLAVMSKCPDAELCESVWDRVLDRVGDLVDLQLVYIAKLDPSEPTYGVTCMHGESECAGNVQQLCAASHWTKDPESTRPWQDWWHFVNCMNYNSRAKIGDVALAETCAKVAGHVWGPKSSECATSDEGRALLRDSVIASTLLGVTKSCTILIEGIPVCLHDGVWKDCPNGHDVSDFADQVRQSFARLNAH